MLSILKNLGIRPEKRKGQHFLTSDEIVANIVEAASLTGKETVLEIGAGPGILTFPLAEHAGEVVAIEVEPAFVGYLKKEAKRRGITNLTIIQGDALRMELPPFDKVVSNLPYHISSPLTFKLLSLDFRLGVLMYQREFGMRLIAQPCTKARGALTLRAGYYADIEGLFQVPRTEFYPIPEVDSIVIRMEKRPFPYQLRDKGFYFKLIKVLFMHRRRKIKNSLLLGFMGLPGASGMKKEEFRKIIISKIPQEILDRRPEELEAAEVAEMANELSRELEER